MIKKKKISTCIFSLFVVLMFSCQTASASDVVQERGPVDYCTQCGTNTEHSVNTTRTYKHDEYFTCIHGTGGRDKYSVYEVKTTVKCKQCGKTNVSKYDDHVFIGCVK